MAEFKLPYYKGHIDCTIPDELVAGVLVSKTESYVPTEMHLIIQLIQNRLANLQNLKNI